MCRGTVPWGNGKYPRNALRSARYVFVSTVPGKKTRRVVGFLLALDSTFVSPLSRESVCRDDEMYLDVVCASLGYGRGLIESLFKAATKLGKTHIRLYSVAGAAKTWEQKYGFKQCDDPDDLYTCKEKIYEDDPDQGVRMTLRIAAYTDTKNRVP